MICPLIAGVYDVIMGKPISRRMLEALRDREFTMEELEEVGPGYP